jgi:methanethiol S-methyltransferase
VSLLLLIILWCAWCVLHSLMISLTVTNYLRTRLGRTYRFYRVVYNFIALVTLIPVIIYGAQFTGPVLFQWDGFSLIFRLLLAVLAGLLFLSGAIKYDLRQLLGIRQIKSGNSYAAIAKTDNIDTAGVLGIIRHPWYLAAIIFIWVGHRDLYVSTLMVNTILTVYIVIGTILEEGKLITEYGDSYREYKQQVSMLFPYKWLFSPKSKRRRAKNKLD